MEKEQNCPFCEHTWVPRKSNPSKCPECNKNIKYKIKTVNLLARKNHIHILVSDKCYSMLLRRKKYKEELLKNVISRLVDENNYSETVRYKEEPVTYEIYISHELKIKLFEIANKYQVRTVNEVIWRLL